MVREQPMFAKPLKAANLRHRARLAGRLDQLAWHLSVYLASNLCMRYVKRTK